MTLSMTMPLLMIGFVFVIMGSPTGGTLLELFNLQLILVIMIQVVIQVIGFSIVVFSNLTGKS